MQGLHTARLTQAPCAYPGSQVGIARWAVVESAAGMHRQQPSAGRQAGSESARGRRSHCRLSESR